MTDISYIRIHVIHTLFHCRFRLRGTPCQQEDADKAKWENKLLHNIYIKV